jgi:TolA-binding protein
MTDPYASGNPNAAPSGQVGAAGMAAVPGSAQDFAVNVGERVFFDTDQYTVRGDAGPVLNAQAAWLARYPQVRVIIEGNADERGTREYNLALGARRAQAVRDVLVSRGVAASRIETVLLRQGTPSGRRLGRGVLCPQPQRPHGHHRRRHDGAGFLTCPLPSPSGEGTPRLSPNFAKLVCEAVVMIRASLLALALLLPAGAASAQQTERDDRRIDRMEKTVREIERIVRQGAATGRPVTVAPETLPGEIESLRGRLDDMQAAHQSLISTVEALTNELNQTRRTATASQAQVSDLQTRLAEAESRAAAAALQPPAPPNTPTAPGAVSPAAAARGASAAGSLGSTPAASGDPAVAFQRARQQLLEGDYASASAGFGAVRRRLPQRRPHAGGPLLAGRDAVHPRGLQRRRPGLHRRPPGLARHLLGARRTGQAGRRADRKSAARSRLPDARRVQPPLRHLLQLGEGPGGRRPHPREVRLEVHRQDANSAKLLEEPWRVLASLALSR